MDRGEDMTTRFAYELASGSLLLRGELAISERGTDAATFVACKRSTTRSAVCPPAVEPLPVTTNATTPTTRSSTPIDASPRHSGGIHWTKGLVEWSSTRSPVQTRSPRAGQQPRRAAVRESE